MWPIARPAASLLAAIALLGARPAFGQALSGPSSDRAPKVSHRAIEGDANTALGERIAQVVVESHDPAWFNGEKVRYVQPGERLSPEVARRALREVLGTGRYADAKASVATGPDGLVLKILVVPRRIIANLSFSAPFLDDEELKRVLGVQVGDELTRAELALLRERLRAYYDERGFPLAVVTANTFDTDDPMRAALDVRVDPGPPREIEQRVFEVSPREAQTLAEPWLSNYSTGPGDRLDRRKLEQADEDLRRVLVSKGFHQARVAHAVDPARGLLQVKAELGPKVLVELFGNRAFDKAQLMSALALETRADRGPESLRQSLEEFYQQRGHLDVEVGLRVVETISSPELAYRFTIVEGERLRIIGRKYPCLSGPRSAAELDQEIDSVLREELPGPGLYSAADPRVIDQTLGPRQVTSRPRPTELQDPSKTFFAPTYDNALKHLQGLYRSSGYLSAVVGPLRLERQRCSPWSRVGECRRVEQPPEAPACIYDELGVPASMPPSESQACEVDRTKGIGCASSAMVSIPVRLGPRTYVYDVAFEGNRAISEKNLLEQAQVALGEPASQALLDEARGRLTALYAEEGFAFADVEATLDLSPDRTRARVRFSILERERVKVSRIVVRGATRTNESLIHGRIALRPGGFYRRSLVRQTEERLATLGVFSSVTVGFEDPQVYAREKVVVVVVQEKVAQYVDPRLGFSTGEGFRFGFEYGHRNLAGEAVQLTLRLNVNYLPDALILDPAVRRKRPPDIANQLERYISLLLAFPEVGLGPLIGLSLEGIDLQDNARDFGLRKDAVVLTLNYRPSSRVSSHLGGSVEFNDARIFFDGNAEQERQRLRDFIRDNPAQRNRFRVPEGETRAIAQRTGVNWDRRDNSLDATRGTFFGIDVEHVTVTPVGEARAQARASQEATPDPFAPSFGDFFRINQRSAGYLRLSQGGLSLALSAGWGVIIHTQEDSRTYPDRLFFMGGVDSIRGFLQDSVVPEDVARRLATQSGGMNAPMLTLREVVIRGGDVFINPRAELRIPLTSSVKTAVFVDAGNVWTEPDQMLDNLALRYAVGTGLRVGTPIGPLVFDYGINVEQFLVQVLPNYPNRRPWEDFGSFHFSIGLF